MRKLLYSGFVIALMLTPVHAQTGPAATKERPPGPSGADGNVYKDGIARDPSEVRAQQGDMKASPGTVGAAPGADGPSSGSKK